MYCNQKYKLIIDVFIKFIHPCIINIILSKYTQNIYKVHIKFEVHYVIINMLLFVWYTIYDYL